MITIVIVTANPTVLGSGLLQITLRSGLITGEIEDRDLYLLSPNSYVNVSG